MHEVLMWLVKSVVANERKSLANGWVFTSEGTRSIRVGVPERSRWTRIFNCNTELCIRGVGSAVLSEPCRAAARPTTQPTHHCYSGRVSASPPPPASARLG
eukprot:365800-Chlamydomonas_euryale.AAC.21